MKDQIRNYIAEITFTEIDAIGNDTALFDEGIFDSMGLLSLISYLDEELGVKTEDEELNEDNFSSVETIVAFVEKKTTLLK